MANIMLLCSFLCATFFAVYLRCAMATAPDYKFVQCESEWDGYGCRCYKLFPNISGAAPFEFCKPVGAVPARILSESENQFALNYALKFFNDSATYPTGKKYKQFLRAIVIDGSRKSTSQPWEWQSRSSCPEYFKWRPGQPSRNGLYIVMLVNEHNQQGKWDDRTPGAQAVLCYKTGIVNNDEESKRNCSDPCA